MILVYERYEVYYNQIKIFVEFLKFGNWMWVKCCGNVKIFLINIIFSEINLFLCVFYEKIMLDIKINM